MNAVTTPAAEASLVEKGYYQWVPLAPGETPPPEDEETAEPPLHSTPACAGAGIGDLADAAASDQAGHHPLTPSSQEEGELIHRAPSGQPVAMTPQRMAVFLESMMVLGNVSIACAKAQVSRPSAYAARRREPGFARAWDAAVVAARTVAESELADRAIHGVEEKVFYHGEEVGSRRRHDSRLLLAHLARLDKAAERLDVAAALPQLDAWIAALHEGAPAAEALPAKIRPDALRTAQAERDFVADPRGQEPSAKYVQDSVRPVRPCPECGGFCTDAQGDDAVALTQSDCQWLGNRLERMDAARPDGAPEPWQLAQEDGVSNDGATIEMLQLDAFEEGLDAWWTLTDREAYDAACERLCLGGEEGSAGLDLSDGEHREDERDADAQAEQHGIEPGALREHERDEGGEDHHGEQAGDQEGGR